MTYSLHEYRVPQTSNISFNLVSNTIHSDVVGAPPVGAAPTAWLQWVGQRELQDIQHIPVYTIFHSICAQFCYVLFRFNSEFFVGFMWTITVFTLRKHIYRPNVWLTFWVLFSFQMFTGPSKQNYTYEVLSYWVNFKPSRELWNPLC